ncbi:MAG: DUF4936 family protein [Candidatus Protistobacter heckmanni]|nr:DUF4936 family protein [Candidatus Protistobacter heckmanni]
MTHSLYVYYRSAEDIGEQLCAFVGFVQADTGVEGRLQRRPGTSSRPEDKGVPMITWMECYDGVEPGFTAELERLWGEFGIAGAIHGERRVELFEDCPCA